MHAAWKVCGRKHDGRDIFSDGEQLRIEHAVEPSRIPCHGCLDVCMKPQNLIFGSRDVNFSVRSLIV